MLHNQLKPWMIVGRMESTWDDDDVKELVRYRVEPELGNPRLLKLVQRTEFGAFINSIEANTVDLSEFEVISDR